MSFLSLAIAEKEKRPQEPRKSSETNKSHHKLTQIDSVEQDKHPHRYRQLMPQQMENLENRKKE